MVGGWYVLFCRGTEKTWYSQSIRSQNFDTEADWNIVTEPSPGANGRQVKVSRGKFLGGSSGVNGTLCVRGTKQDFDDWDLPGWDGEEVFGYMKKVTE
jgi:choline dehydrogenase-like flavoprotein